MMEEVGVESISASPNTYRMNYFISFGPKGFIDLNSAEQYIPNGEDYEEEDEYAEEYESLKEDYDTLPDGFIKKDWMQDGHYIYFKKVDGKGKWIASKELEGPFFDITYDQARGYEPIDNSSTKRLKRYLGKMLLSK